jgi:GT2 family glycosyltransferase
VESIIKNSVEPESVSGALRPHVAGKFIFLSDKKLYVRGATYGAFRPDADGNEFHNDEVIERDFALMAANGLTAVRIPHITPPRSLLDIAQRHGLHVMVGLSAEQYVGYLIDKKDAPDIERLVREKVRAIAGHPALLCYAIGNEIPASIVRWLGRRRVERYLERLYRVVKAEDPGGLVSYVNYPTTEYLQLPFLDLLCFNVYLETQDRLEAYLPRLQNIAGDRPLIMSEVGLDSLRNGEEKQASVLEWQVRSAFASGCAGTFIFAWTDEWFMGGTETKEWLFGLTDRYREPKPALESVRNAFGQVPFPPNMIWPKVSVVVCSYNGAKTIRECCEGLSKVAYPNFEVIVVDDGSTDTTLEIAREYGFCVICTEKLGLSKARNTGLSAATGEIVAYIDDDAYPDRHWLTYLAATFLSTEHDGVGGPNIAPSGDGVTADSVANAPGGPIHVLLSDHEAEHIPGCNMAFRRTALEAIGGFDPQFRVAGDDVDVCWRIQQSGRSLGFSPAAMVWHHRRNSVRAYWKQQVGYGRAERLLQRKWPGKYNALGHLRWAGRIYQNGLGRPQASRRSQVFHGKWGSAPFQSMYDPGTGTLLSLSRTPEWYLLLLVLAGLSAMGALWRPLYLAVPLLISAVALTIAQAILSSKNASIPQAHYSKAGRMRMRILTTFLHLLQPTARLWGRLQFDLVPWRRRWLTGFAFPRLHISSMWSECWQSPETRLGTVEAELRSESAVVWRGGDHDGWDLEVRGGPLGSVRSRILVEDHGSNKQLVLFRMWPRVGLPQLLLTVLLALLAIVAAVVQAWLASAILGFVAVALATRMIGDCSFAMSSFLSALERPGVAQE